MYLFVRNLKENTQFIISKDKLDDKNCDSFVGEKIKIVIDKDDWKNFMPETLTAILGKVIKFINN